MITLRKSKSLQRITREWDAIAAIRDEQVCSGKDHSANFVLAPAILGELSKVASLIDIGCGTGWLTERAAKFAEKIVGIDPSEESISIGCQRHHGAGITYHAESIESYASQGKKFDLGISNMSVSGSPDLDTFFSASRKVLKKNALFVFTIPHPYFWPLYWGYMSHPRFNYLESCAIESEFNIQGEKSNIVTTHFHHPLERYVGALSDCKFSVESMRELSGRGFPFPRFMLIRSRAL